MRNKDLIEISNTSFTVTFKLLIYSLGALLWLLLERHLSLHCVT